LPLRSSDDELQRKLLLIRVTRDALEALYSGPSASFDVAGVVRYQLVCGRGRRHRERQCQQPLIVAAALARLSGL
jgi:hypothetical protein